MSPHLEAGLGPRSSTLLSFGIYREVVTAMAILISQLKMDPQLRLFLQANAAIMAGQNGLRVLWWLWLQAVGARNRRRRRRRLWTRGWILERPRYGLYENLLGDLERNDPSSYRNFTRCGPELFQFILQRITPAIARIPNNYRAPGRPGSQLEPGLMLAVTLRYLASGSMFTDLQWGFRLAPNTISEVVREVCQAIVDQFWDEFIVTPSTEVQWRAIADAFRLRWNCHHALGAIDGKHVAIQKPPHAGSEFYNYKKFHSIIILAVVDANYKFIWLDIGTNGAAGDAQIWNNSGLKLGLSTNRLNLPPPEPLPGDTTDIPFYLIGDDAFALEEFLMKPYAQRNLTREERIFNYRLSRARRVVENAFGIMSMRFRVLTTTMRHRPEIATLVTSTCCVLHNIIRDRYPVMQAPMLDREDQHHNLIPGAWRNGYDMHEINRNIGGNTSKKRAKAQRDLLKLYYNDIGAVPWQDRMI